MEHRGFSRAWPTSRTCYLSINQSVLLSVYLSIFLSIHPSIHPSIHIIPGRHSGRAIDPSTRPSFHRHDTWPTSRMGCPSVRPSYPYDYKEAHMQLSTHPCLCPRHAWPPPVHPSILVCVCVCVCVCLGRRPARVIHPPLHPRIPPSILLSMRYLHPSIFPST